MIDSVKCESPSKIIEEITSTSRSFGFKEMVDFIIKHKSEEIVFDLIGGWKRVGDVYQTNCPFHDDRNPSFTFYYKDERPHFHCFGCDFHGDIINVVAELKNMSNGEAINWIKENYFMPKEFLNSDEDAQQGKVLYANPELEKIAELATRNKETALELIKNRNDGIDIEVAEKFVIGYLKPEYGHRLAGRVLFPIKDTKGVIIGFTGWNPHKKPKYYHYPKELKVSHTFFNIDNGFKAAAKDGYIVIVEGVFDVIKLTQCGVKNVVAILGSNLSPKQADMLKDLGVTPLFCFDGDEAGKKALYRAYKRLKARDEILLHYVELPPGEDPASYFKPGNYNVKSFGGLEVKTKVIVENVNNTEELYNFGLDEETIERYKNTIGKSGKNKRPRIRKFIEFIEDNIDKKFRIVEFHHRYFIIFLDGNKNIAYDISSKKVTKFIIAIATELFGGFNNSDLGLCKTILETYAKRPEHYNIYFCPRRAIYVDGVYWYLRDQESGECFMIDVKTGTITNGSTIPPDNIVFAYSPLREPLTYIDSNMDEKKYKETLQLFHDIFRTETPVDGIMLYNHIISGYLTFKERPMLNLTGKPGCGKTTTAKAIGLLVDPDGSMFLPQRFNKEKDLPIFFSSGSKVQIMDNVTSIDSKTADIIASITQGRDIRCRKLYTDSEVNSVYIDPDTMIIVTSFFENFTTRDDIIDRSITVRLRKDNGLRDVYAVVKENMPKLLAHIFYVIWYCLKNDIIEGEIINYWKLKRLIFESQPEIKMSVKDIEKLAMNIDAIKGNYRREEASKNKFVYVNRNTVNKDVVARLKTEGQFKFLYALNAKIGNLTDRTSFFYYLAFHLCNNPLTYAGNLLISDELFDSEAENRVYDMLLAKTDSSSQNPIISAVYHYLSEYGPYTGTYFKLYQELSERYSAIKNIDYRTFVRNVSRLNNSGNIFGIKLVRHNRKVVEGSKRQFIELSLVEQTDTVMKYYTEFKKEILTALDNTPKEPVEVNEMAEYDRKPIEVLEEFLYDVENELITRDILEISNNTILEAARILGQKALENKEVMKVITSKKPLPTISLKGFTQWTAELPDGSQGTNKLYHLLLGFQKHILTKQTQKRQ